VPAHGVDEGAHVGGILDAGLSAPYPIQLSVLSAPYPETETFPVSTPETSSGFGF